MSKPGSEVYWDHEKRALYYMGRKLVDKETWRSIPVRIYLDDIKYTSPLVPNQVYNALVKYENELNRAQDDEQMGILDQERLDRARSFREALVELIIRTGKE